MSTILFLSDLHIGHDKLAAVRGFSSLQTMHSVIEDAWRSVVSKNDTVIVAGDVVWKKSWVPWFQALPGRKRLVMGNHDRWPNGLLRDTFISVHGALYFHNYLVTHVPVHPDCVLPRFLGNIHGHTHSKKLRGPYHNICCEQLDYTPRSLDYVVEYGPES